MAEIAVRELKNRLSEIVRDVELGNEYVVTVDRRPVARLAPLPRRATWVPLRDFIAAFEGRWADPELLAELDELVGDTVEDL
jgi:prevent-host-death family protein